MRHGLGIIAVAALVFTGVACNSGRYSTSGFHLPRNGNVERGRVAFVELGCNGCHKVAGAGLASPTVTPAVPVVLGGETSRRLSDAYLVTAMLDPNYHLAPHQQGEITAGGRSRMPEFADRITARQMVDVVAFLQSQYVIRRFTPNYTFQ